MKIAIAHSFAAAPGEVYAALINPVVLQRCIEGCQTMVKTGEDTFDTVLKVGIAGLKGSYSGRVKITSKQPGESLTLAIDGKGGAGFIKASSQIRLSGNGDRTELSGEGDATVGGMIAAIGSRLIEAAAKKMMTDFFARIESDIKAHRAS